ncbi:Cacna1h, partial [Symbiodinium pilosum]
NDISGNADGVTGLKALRIVRVTRVLKVVRLMRVFRFVMAFRTLITSIAFTLKSLFWALMLLLVIVY